MSVVVDSNSGMGAPGIGPIIWLNWIVVNASGPVPFVSWPVKPPPGTDQLLMVAAWFIGPRLMMVEE